MQSLMTRNGNPRSNSVELWRGPSRIDGAPIVVIASGLKASANSKTGDMVQTYILRADIEPTEALARGLDVSICGGCPKRPTEVMVSRRKNGREVIGYRGRSCYVNVGQGPLSIWRAWARGKVPAVSSAEIGELVRGRMVRLGSYGDPAAAPLSVWRAYAATARGWTGYTHQWRNAKLRDVLELCQVSADSLADAESARAAGIGSFRVLAEGQEPAPFERGCPASEETGRVATCADCGMCSGFDGESVAIRAHGIGAQYVTTERPRRRVSLPVINPARALAVA